MSDPKSLNIESERLLAMAGNLLSDYFVKANKDLGKKRFKELSGGAVIKLATLENNIGEQQLDVHLCLDHSEFRGHLTFHLFASCLGSMLKNCHAHLSNKKELPIFTEQTTGAGLFLIPGVVQDSETANMLVLGFEAKVGQLQLKLQFIDPDQFKTDE